MKCHPVSFVSNMTISSKNKNLSPVIDVKRLNMFAISNRLNNPTVSSTDTFTNDVSTTAFTLSSTPSDVHILAVTKSGKPLSPVVDLRYQYYINNDISTSKWRKSYC